MSGEDLRTIQTALQICERVEPGFTRGWCQREWLKTARAQLEWAGVAIDAPPAERRESILARLRSELSLPAGANSVEIHRATTGVADGELGGLYRALLQHARNPGAIDADAAGRVFAIDDPFSESAEYRAMVEAEERRRSEEAAYVLRLDEVERRPLAPPPAPEAGGESGEADPPLLPLTAFERARRLLKAGDRVPDDLLEQLTTMERDMLSRQFHVKLSWSIGDPDAPFNVAKRKVF